MSKEPKTQVPLATMTVKELRKLVVKLGMSEENAELFETKKPLIATIDALRVKKIVETPGQIKRDDEKYLSKKETMRKLLMAQPRVQIRIPLEGQDKPGVVKWVYNKRTKREEQIYFDGAYTPVQLNGFKWIVPHGPYVSVPQQVADVIREQQNASMDNSGNAFLTDRQDPKTGKPVGATLE